MVSIEIRAGITRIHRSYKGPIRTNKLCGRIEVRGGEDRAYTIMCETSIDADYITVQMMDDDATLYINELEVIDHLEGK